jgi:glycosyltransferase involved in cell wall biosynthesis
MPDGQPWPLISIVTPSFNQADFLEETIRSVLLQGYPNLEYFIVDGGSSDGSVEIIKKYEPWLTGWVSEKDRGQSHAINKGFARCTGDLLTFQNSDDYYLSDAFAEAARCYSCDLGSGGVVGAFQSFSEDGALSEPRLPVLKATSPYDLSVGPPGVYRLHQVSTFFTRRALDKVGRHVREDMHYTMDREILFRVCRKFRIQTVGRTLGVFRIQDQSKSVNDILPFAADWSRLYLMHLDDDRNANRRRRAMAAHYLARGCLHQALKGRSLGEVVRLLVRAAYYRKELIFRRSYYKDALNAIRSSLHNSRQPAVSNE